MGSIEHVRKHCKTMLLGLAAVCYLEALLSCLYGPMTIVDHAPSRASEAVWAGCIVGGLGCVALTMARPLRKEGRAWGVICVAAFVIGVLPSACAYAGLPLPSAVIVGCGVLRGCGLVCLGVAWTCTVGTAPFDRLLPAVAAASLIAVLMATALGEMGGYPAAVGALAMAALATLPFWHVGRIFDAVDARGGDSVPRARKPGSRKLSALPSLFYVLASSAIGAMLSIVFVHAQPQPVLQGLVPESSFGVVSASLVLLAASLWGAKRLNLPFIQWVACPAAAALIVVLSSFPVSGIAFRIGAIAVFAFFAALGLLSLVVLAKVNSRGEFSPLMTTGLSFCCFAVAAWAGSLLAASGLPVAQRGELLLVVATTYFAFLLVAPGVRLWRTSKLPEEPLEWESGEREKPHASGEKAAEEACAEVAVAYGLSAREAELLPYAFQGYTSTYIAKALFISDNTVRSHLKNIYRKLGVSSKMELIDLVKRRRSE